jgi:hypothetical protein
MAGNLLHDGYQNKFELAELITNDSGLLSAIQTFQDDLGLKVGILNPQKHASKVLKNKALLLKIYVRGL